MTAFLRTWFSSTTGFRFFRARESRRTCYARSRRPSIFARSFCHSPSQAIALCYNDVASERCPWRWSLCCGSPDSSRVPKSEHTLSARGAELTGGFETVFNDRRLRRIRNHQAQRRLVLAGGPARNRQRRTRTSLEASPSQPSVEGTSSHKRERPAHYTRSSRRYGPDISDSEVRGRLAVHARHLSVSTLCGIGNCVVKTLSCSALATKEILGGAENSVRALHP